MRRLHLIGLMLATLTSTFGADNVLTRQEKTQGWILLFDGKTLNGWDSAVTSNPGQGRGPGSATKQGKSPAQPGPPAVGSNPRACSTPVGKATVPEGASHWEVVGGLLVPCGEPAGYLTSKATYRDFVLVVDFRTGEDTNSGVFIRAPGGTGGYEVQINRPYAGGFITEYYGNPAHGIQCLQLEINRALYLDEATLSKSKNFPSLAQTLAALASQVFQALPALLERRAAAE